MENEIKRHMSSHLQVAETMMADQKIIEKTSEAIRIISDTFRNRSRLFLAGNGGSAADAQHIAAEFVNRFYLEREGLPALALTTDTSVLTAIGNDYSFDRIFSRQISSLGADGDAFWALSTSGNSVNIIEAFRECKKRNIKTIGFTGATGGAMEAYCDVIIKIPADETPRIQEMHILLAHIICAEVEELMFNTR